MNDQTKAIVTAWCTALAGVICAFIPMTPAQQVAVYAFLAATGGLLVWIYYQRHAKACNGPPPPPPPPSKP